MILNEYNHNQYQRRSVRKIHININPVYFSDLYCNEWRGAGHGYGSSNLFGQGKGSGNLSGCGWDTGVGCGAGYSRGGGFSSGRGGH